MYCSKCLHTLSIVVAALLSPLYAHAAAKGWEPVKTEHHDAKTIILEETAEIEIKTIPSVIIIDVSKPTHIEVFTILGRLVSSTTLQPGIHELEVGAHGVYIVKAGELTCKVAI